MPPLTSQTPGAGRLTLHRRSEIQGFKSLWQADFEGVKHLKGSGLPLSMNAVTQHDARAADENNGRGQFGIDTMREGVCWLAERNGGMDFPFGEERAPAMRPFAIQVGGHFAPTGCRATSIPAAETIHLLTRHCGAARPRDGFFFLT